MICKQCKIQMDRTTNKGPNMGMRMDAIVVERCSQCQTAWTLYHNSEFFGSRNRRRIKEMKRQDNAS